MAAMTFKFKKLQRVFFSLYSRRLPWREKGEVITLRSSCRLDHPVDPVFDGDKWRGDRHANGSRALIQHPWVARSIMYALCRAVEIK